MRSRDWSSDVCSSDRVNLDAENHFGSVTRHVLDVNYRSTPLVVAASDAVIRKNPNRFPKSVRSARPEDQSKVVIHRAPTAAAEGQEIGRASCRERVCQYV